MDDPVSANPRLTIYPLAIIIAVVLGVVLGSYAANSRSESFGGDYPAFYSAGTIAAAGDWDELYTLERQIEAQASLPSDKDETGARFFAYPPQVAFVFQPLAQLDYFASYLFHTILMGALLAAGLWLARPMVPWLHRHLTLSIAAALVFWPMFRSITGGSNTALTMFLMIAGWRLVYVGHPFGAGIVFAMLLYKPQFAFPLVGLFLLRRNWQVVGGALVGGSAFYLSGVALRGWGWVGEWFEVASEFGKLDAEVNGHSAISLVGFTENLFGVGVSVATVAAWGLVIVCVGIIGWLWWRDTELELDRLMAVTLPGLLLISPHAMSHDGALVVLTAAVAGSRWPVRRWMPWAVTVWILGATQLGIKAYGFSPGFVMLLVVLAWGWLLVSDGSRQDERRVSVDSVI